MIKTKFMITSILTLLLTLTIISATTFTANPSSLRYNQPNTQLTFTLTPNDLTIPSTYTLTFPTINQDNDQVVSFTVTGDNVHGDTVGPILLAPETITVNAVNVDYTEISVGKTYSGNLVITNIADPSDPMNIPISFTSSFCKAGEQGTYLEITDVKIDNSDGDDEEWSPLDEIEIEVEVSNNHDEKIKDVKVELGLFNSEGKDVAKDLDDLKDDEIDLKSIKEDDEDTAVYTFKIPADFEDDNYKLVIKAYSEDDDYGEDLLCVSKSPDFDNEYYQKIDGIREEDDEKHIIFNNIKVSPSTAKCGERVQITGEIFNIGNEDYEDQVKVTLFNEELGLNLEQVVRKDLDWGDSEIVEFEFDVPEEIAEKLHVLEFKTHYEYDEDEDTYDITSDDVFKFTVRVEGDCEKEVKAAIITAELDPETPDAVAGKQVIVNANLENSGDIETTYTVSVSGNSAWSNLVSLDPQIITIAPGESKDINIVLSVNEDAEGDNEFTIRASYEDQTTEQKVVLPVLAEQEAELGPAVQHIRDNWFIYLIILINIILIIAIILVIKSMVAPRPM